MWDDVTRAPREDHVTAVVSLALAATARCGDVVVIALDGPSGAGKTTLARGVELALEPVAPVAVVHMDHLYPGWDGLARGPGLLTTRRCWSRSPEASGRHTGPGAGARRVGRLAGGAPVPLPRRGGVRFQRAARGGVCRRVRLRRRRGRAAEVSRDRARRRGLPSAVERWADQETALFTADATRQRADLVLDTSSL